MIDSGETETLLWTNPNPTAVQSSSTVTLSNPLNLFKKIKVQFRAQIANETTFEYIFPIENFEIQFSGFNLFGGVANLGSNYYARTIGLNNNLTIEGNQLLIGNCTTTNNVLANAFMIVTNIYGIN